MILIKNITIITQNPRREIIKKGTIAIEKDRIKAVGRQYQGKTKKVIDGKGKVALPGLINTHGHLAMTLLRGWADDVNLEEWWLKHIYPVESKFTRQEVYWGSLLAMIEMIKSGTTCFADFYYYLDQVGKAAEKIGMRGILGCAILDLETFQFKNSDEAIKITESVVKRFSDSNLLKVALCPHMFQTTSLATYQKSKKLAKDYDLLLSSHISESKQEVDYSLKKYKKRPIEVLAEAGILDERTLLAHCCWLTKKEIKILAKSGASVSHCPISNMKLASGTMPLVEILEAGVNVGLGTDSACSNNNLDMFEEMKTAALLHKINQLDPTVASAQTILDMATINGAKALGLDKEVGSLESNKKADIIILDFAKPHLIPHHNLVSHLVYSAKGSDVETSIIDGKVIMEKRSIKKIQESRVLNKIIKNAKFN